ncbi:DMT family transporter [Brevibacterium album]|uniref:DMT family transporter n=1 Tax=Brevibacterium album TaxID=417948 RepID=UPI000412A01C|nr:DMT family transporter [Brevibacterium album]
MPLVAKRPESLPAGAGSPRVLGAAAVTVVLWASAFVVIRGLGEHFGPGSMALLRMAVGSAVLGAIAALSGARMPSLRDLPLIAVWGISWFSLYNLALNWAEVFLDAGTVAMLVNLAPLIVIVFGAVFLREGFPGPLLIGAPVSFLGVVLIGSSSWTGSKAVGGVVLAVTAAFLYGGSALLQKRLLRDADATALTFLGALVGTAALLPWTGELVHDLAHASLPATLGVVYLGVFPTGVAFTTWAYVLSRTSAGRTAATTYAVPAVVLVMSWLLLAEIPTPVMFAGGALCLLGVFITRLPTRRAPAGRVSAGPGQ